MRERKRLLLQRIIVAINLADGKVSCHTPPGIHLAQHLRSASPCFCFHVFKIYHLLTTASIFAVDADYMPVGESSVFICFREFRTTFTSSRINSGTAPTASSRKQSASEMNDVFSRLESVAL